MKSTARTLLPIIACIVLAGFGGRAVWAGADARSSSSSESFVKLCAPCHGKDGKAQTPAAKKLGVKDLSLSTLTDEQIIHQIQEGKPANEKQKTSKMPAFKDKLKPEEINALVPVVKGFRKGG